MSSTRSTAPLKREPFERASSDQSVRSGWRAVAVWAVLIAIAFGCGRLLYLTGRLPSDPLAPLHSRPRLLGWELLPAIAVGAGLVAVLPELSRRSSWRALLAWSWLAAVAWAVALAVSDGTDALTRPLTSRGEYFGGLAAVQADPLTWVDTFSERLLSYPTHVAGHPPLPMLFLWGLDAIGLDGPGWAATAIIVTGCSAVVAVAITLKIIAGEPVARRAVPFLVLAPLALWVATSMDALFLGVGAWATVLLALAARRGSLPYALGSGLLLGALPYLSYGLLPLFAIPLAVAILLRPARLVLVMALAGAAVIPIAITLAGFWWPDGVAATHAAYVITGGSAQRPYLYFFIGNLAVLGLLTGPATAHALPALVRTRNTFAIPVAAALIGVLALDVSGVTRGEVERIWLPYALWMLAAAAIHRLPARRWLAAQAATALVVQALSISNW